MAYTGDIYIYTTAAWKYGGGISISMGGYNPLEPYAPGGFFISKK